MSKTTGVKAGWLIVSKDRILKDHTLVCEDGVVVDMVPNSKVVGDSRFVDARDCIVSPGFLNTHSHMYNVIIRGKDFHSTATSLKAMLEEWWWAKVEDRVNHEMIEVAARIGCIEMLKCGVTCMDDILEAPNSVPGCLRLEAEVLKKAGMRGILSVESCERISHENGMLCLQENYDFIKRQRAENSSIRGMMCVHTTFSCSPEFLRTGKKMADEAGSDIQLHCSEGPDEPRWCMATFGKLPMEHYEEIGFLDSNVLASQCVIMDPHELALMAKRGTRVSHQPISNSHDGCGIAPVPDMLRLGIPVGLGTDGENNDLLEVMRTAISIHRAKRINPKALSATEAFYMATENGARAIGYTEIGTLDIGKQADYISVKADTPTPLNDENILDQLVRFRRSSDITSTTIAGNLVMQNGEVLTLNEEQAKKDCREITEEYWRTV